MDNYNRKVVNFKDFSIDESLSISSGDEFSNDFNNYNTWDDIFDIQSKKDGSNYTLLKEFLKSNFKTPELIK
jgi:hypothetical protein